MDRDVAVVIGVGGMGQAIARRIAGGRSLLLADFNESTLNAVADQLRGEGQDVTTRSVDVSDRDSVAGLGDAAAGSPRLPTRRAFRPSRRPSRRSFAWTWLASPMPSTSSGGSSHQAEPAL